MEHLAKNIQKEQDELEALPQEMFADGYLEYYVEDMREGRKKKTAEVLLEVNSHLKVVTGTKRSTGKFCERKVPRVVDILKKFSGTVSNIETLIEHYILVDDGDEFMYLHWTKDVLTAAQNEVEDLLETITEEENNRVKIGTTKKTLKKEISLMIEYLAKAMSILTPFINVEEKLQDAYELQNDLKASVYNFASLYARIVREEPPTHTSTVCEALKKDIDKHFAALQESVSSFVKTIYDMYNEEEKKPAALGRSDSADDESGSTDDESDT
jgi:hypothetical protein